MARVYYNYYCGVYAGEPFDGGETTFTWRMWYCYRGARVIDLHEERVKLRMLAGDSQSMKEQT